MLLIDIGLGTILTGISPPRCGPLCGLGYFCLMGMTDARRRVSKKTAWREVVAEEQE